MITIVDYGVGNLASIQNMLARANVDSRICSSEFEIRSASKLILPGVGAFDTCVIKLHESGLLDTLNTKVLHERIPVMGVCVGHQLLFETSEEGKMPGLGWLKGKVVKFAGLEKPVKLKVPHMGWTEVVPAKQSRILTDLQEAVRFYFVHSYFALPDDPADVLMHATYGVPFTAAVEKGNILGVQFHPEKSHRYGLKLLANFAAYF